MTPGVHIRPATDGDLAYILETWLEGQRPEFPDMRDGDYYPWQRARIMRLVGSKLSTLGVEDLNHAPGNAALTVACPVDAPSVIWAWMCSESAAVHYVYVRPAHRRTGLARRLVSRETPINVTALSPDARAIKRAHPDLMRFVPL